MSFISMKSSFDRFGDDLIELVLSYLSLKKCFRFRCVSKQWKRLIFNKQKHLDLSRNSHSNELEIILKNCANIRSIVVVSFCWIWNYRQTNYLLQLL